MEGWTPKEVTSLLVQTGAVGLCFMILLLGVFIVAMKIDKLHDVIFKLCCIVVDRTPRAPRPGDITPPEREAVRIKDAMDPDKSGIFQVKKDA